TCDPGSAAESGLPRADVGEFTLCDFGLRCWTVVRRHEEVGRRAIGRAELGLHSLLAAAAGRLALEDDGRLARRGLLWLGPIGEVEGQPFRSLDEPAEGV